MTWKRQQHRRRPGRRGWAEPDAEEPWGDSWEDGEEPEGFWDDPDESWDDLEESWEDSEDEEDSFDRVSGARSARDESWDPESDSWLDALDRDR